MVYTHFVPKLHTINEWVLRSLCADEILVQVYYACKVCRVVQSCLNNNNYNPQGQSRAIPPIDNIVFMLEY